MEAPDEVEALRYTANARLQALLQNAAGKSPQETAALITELAYEHANPVRDFFAAANSISLEAPPSPRSALKSRSSRSILRFSRSNKVGLIDSKATAPNPPKQTIPNVNSAGATSTGRMSTKAVPMSSCFSTAPRPMKGTASQYQCIICDEFLSSKGVCKRHLEDQHVSPKQYKCEKCAMIFTVKAKCKEHIKDCGKGVFLYVVVKPEEKKVYACDFTGDVFSSMARYVEHLLSLSERTEDRPAGDLHRKLHALLDRPYLEPYVAEHSSRLFGSSSTWRNLYWDMAHLSKAIETLEHATVHENGRLEVAKHVADGQKGRSTESFVGALLCEGKVRPGSRSTIRPGSGPRKDAMSRSSSTSFGSSQTITPKASLNPVSALDAPAFVSAPEATNVPSMAIIPAAVLASGALDDMAQTPVDVKAKRHLSDHSRFFVPTRIPPGPPLPPDLLPFYGVHTQTSGHTTSINSSTTSLPFRPPDAPGGPTSVPMDYHPQQVPTPSVETTDSSDAASVSTLMSNYQEPELVTPMPFDYNMWHSHPNTIPFPIPHNMNYNLPNQDFYYQHPSAAPTRTPSIATDQTYVVDFIGDQKSLNFDTNSMHAVPQSGTFLWDEEEGNDVNAMH